MLQSINQPHFLVWGEGALENTFAPSPHICRSVLAHIGTFCGIIQHSNLHTYIGIDKASKLVFLLKQLNSSAKRMCVSWFPPMFLIRLF